jgi:hypothetical protein
VVTALGASQLTPSDHEVKSTAATLWQGLRFTTRRPGADARPIVLLVRPLERRINCERRQNKESVPRRSTNQRVFFGRSTFLGENTKTPPALISFGAGYDKNEEALNPSALDQHKRTKFAAPQRESYEKITECLFPLRLRHLFKDYTCCGAPKAGLSPSLRYYLY